MRVWLLLGVRWGGCCSCVADVLLFTQPGAVVAAAPAAVLLDAVRTGAVFSLLQGAFYQVSLSTVYCPLATCISPPLCFLIRLAT